MLLLIVCSPTLLRNMPVTARVATISELVLLVVVVGYGRYIDGTGTVMSSVCSAVMVHGRGICTTVLAVGGRVVFGAVLNDNDFLRQAIFVERAPIGRTRSPTLPRRL